MPRDAGEEQDARALLWSGILLLPRAAVQFAILCEIFDGVAALSSAVRDLAPPAHALNAGDAWRDEQQDL